MPRTTYLAVLNGEIIGKRTSDNRVYTHVVVGRPSYASDLAYAKSDYHYDASKFAWYSKKVAAGPNGKHIDGNYTYDVTPEEHARAVEHVSGCGNAAEYRKKKVAERVAAIEAKKASGHYDAFQALTWCGRLDLARKQISRGWASYEDLQILEVTKKGA